MRKEFTDNQIVQAQMGSSADGVFPVRKDVGPANQGFEIVSMGRLSRSEDTTDPFVSELSVYSQMDEGTISLAQLVNWDPVGLAILQNVYKGVQASRSDLATLLGREDKRITAYTQRALDAKLQEINEQILPSGCTIVPVFDRGEDTGRVIIVQGEADFVDKAEVGIRTSENPAGIIQKPHEPILANAEDMAFLRHIEAKEEKMPEVYDSGALSARLENIGDDLLGVFLVRLATPLDRKELAANFPTEATELINLLSVDQDNLDKIIGMTGMSLKEVLGAAFIERLEYYWNRHGQQRVEEGRAQKFVSAVKALVNAGVTIDSVVFEAFQHLQLSLPQQYSNAAKDDNLHLAGEKSDRRAGPRGRKYVSSVQY